jgi:amino acid efflux transporter
VTGSTTTAPATRAGISVLQGTALTLGAVLGTGVISLPALAVAKAGPASLLAWGALLVVSVPLATTFAALGARHPDGGGVTTYARLAFGDAVATALGWAFFVTIGIGAPVAAGFAGAYVADQVGGGRHTTLAVAAAIMIVVTVLNWLGIRLSARVQLAIAVVLAAVLAVTVLVALPHAEAGNLHPFAPHGLHGVVAAVGALVWAFAGWEIMASVTGEYAHPARDIPRAAAATLGIVAVLYLGVALATTAVLGDHPGQAPLSALLVVGVGEVARPVMTVVALLLTVGTMNSYFAGAARLGAALARERSLPTWLDQSGEPRRALIVVAMTGLGTLGVMAVTRAGTERTLLVTTGTFSVAYLVATGAAVKLLPRRSWGWIAAVVSVLASLGLVVATGWAVLVPVLIGLVGTAWTALRRRAAGGVSTADALAEPVADPAPDLG